MKLNREFYLRDTTTVAKELIGKVLVHRGENFTLKGRIVETEAYLGIRDPAAHSYNGRRTERTEAMYAEGGTSYVFFIYGMYYCFNVVTQEAGVPEAVLIRGIEPSEECRDEMSLRRYGKPWKELSDGRRHNLSNGPGKLSKALRLDMSANGIDLLSDKLYLEEGAAEENILVSQRIGIDYAGEARDWLLRFYSEGNPYVSPNRGK